MELPQRFTEQMQMEFGENWPAYVQACSQKPWRGLRLNEGKLAHLGDNLSRVGSLKRLADAESVEWCANGRYLTDESAGKSPLHYAGAYYIQEPSAMLPAAMLKARPGDWVLDLCAAPGGKSTQLIDDMKDTGLLVSNDISASRGKAIVKNLERFGVGQILVTAESPERLAAVFPGCFDRILVDAPCSGEGMFRREPSMREEWLEKGPEYYAPLQRQILTEAVKMLRPGGRLVYSTCTFSRLEDEDNAAWLSDSFPELTLLEQRKLLPHEVKGEGQYAALFEKRADCAKQDDDSEEDIRSVSETEADGRQPQRGSCRGAIGNFREKGNEAVLSFFRLTGRPWQTDRWYLKDGQLYELPADITVMRGLRFLRTGLLLGEMKNGRFEPSQALAIYLTAEEFANRVDFAAEDERVYRYLKGETVDAAGALHTGSDGWCLVTMEGVALGWAKRTGDTLKNKYAPGWRMQ